MLSCEWESTVATHCDRHWFSGVDPFETDLPEDLAAALQKVGATKGNPFFGTGEMAVCGELSAEVLATTEDEAAGYLPLLYALKNATSKQADFTPLAALNEPYSRPHADDAAFYATPRFVNHLDSAAQAVWRKFTARFVRPDSNVLDLMASHDSHLPAGLRPACLVGLGMNADELAHNPALTERIVHDLNTVPTLPLPAAQFDVVLCALSIEYLAQPEAVLCEVKRVLKPGGQCVISFSERWFPPKAVLPWPELPAFSRLAWVLRHLQRAGFVDLHTESLRGLPRPRDDKYFAQVTTADPFFAAWGSPAS